MSAVARAPLAPGGGLRLIDAACRAEHHYLEADDQCWYLAAYRPGGCRRHRFNRLLLDFKCPPSLAATDIRQRRHKQEAVARIAGALRGAVERAFVESCTWVPIPPSSASDDPDYDDRLPCALRLAFAGYALDLRQPLHQRATLPADHQGARRTPPQALERLLQLDVAVLAARPLRARIVLFDDVLTSGKHFKCCQRRLLEAVPYVPICGCFIARRALPPQPGRLPVRWSGGAGGLSQISAGHRGRGRRSTGPRASGCPACL